MKKLLKKAVAVTLVLLLFASNGAVFAKEGFGGATEGILNEHLRTLYEKGIFTGDENGDFHLENYLSRAEFCKVICMISSVAPTKNAKPVFPDVDESFWAAGYIDAAYKNGIVNGDENGLFNPDDTILVQDAVKIIVSALGYKEDAEALMGYPVGYIITAGNLGITKNTKLVAENPLKRFEAVELIYNTLDVPLAVK